MSDTPPKPDGSDPRVVTPDSDDETVILSNVNSSANTYHTTECYSVRQMDYQREVSMSVAEWRDATLCSRCARNEGDDDTDTNNTRHGPRTGATPTQMLHGVAPVECVQIRCLVLDGHSQADAADVVNASESTANRHALDRCACDHDMPGLEWDGSSYRVEDFSGGITAARCDYIRHALPRFGVTAALLARLYDVDEDTIRAHGQGRCNHSGADPATLEGGVWHR